MLFSALIMWVQGLFLKLNFGSLREVVFILRWTTWWLRRLDVALQITKGTWWARTCWKTTWIAEIGKARIITGGCFLVFSRCFCYNFSLQNKGVLWSLGIHKKVIHYQIILEDFQYASTLFMNHFETIVPSMWFWSVSWSTNCPVFFSFFLVDQKKNCPVSGNFWSVSGNFWYTKKKFGQPKKILVHQKEIWSTKNSQRLTKNSLRLDNFFLVDQKKWEKDRTIGRPRDWPKPHGRDCCM